MPDDGGSQVHFQIQHVGSPAEDAGVGAGPPDPCPKNAAPAHVPANPGSSRDPLKRFLTQAHRDLLGRAPTKDEVKYLHSVLESGAATRYQVALAILSSPEYRTKLARNILKEFFRRGATPAEASSGKNQLGAHSDEAYKAVLMGSQEYFTKCSHSDDESFVQHVYRDLLHREVDPGALTAEMNKLKNGESRETIVIGLLSSDEYFGRTIRQLYKDLLNRDPTPAELAASRSKLKSGGSVEQLKANLMGSAEYYFGRTGVNPFFEHPKVNLAKHRVKVTMLRKGIFRLVVQKVKSGHTTLKATTLEPTKLEIPNLVRVGVVNFGELGKGQQRKGWDGTIKGKQLKPGNYLLVPEVVDPHGHLLYIIAPAALKVKEKGNR
jgi:hypothetical protein